MTLRKLMRLYMKFKDEPDNKCTDIHFTQHRMQILNFIIGKIEEKLGVKK